MELRKEDFPALYLAADKSATASQHRYLRLTGVILGALVTTAVLSSVRSALPDWKTTIALVTAGVAALSFILTTFRRALKPERRWFVSRAVAEAVKSMTWKFVSGAAPYPASLSAEQASTRLLGDLRATVEDGRVALGLGSEFAGHRQITPVMQSLRSAPLEARRDLYVSNRVQDQRRWYGGASRKNQRRADVLYVAIQIAQAIGLASTALVLSEDAQGIEVTGVFAALASAMIAWSQLRQHEELAQSYAMAALELGLAEESAATVKSDEAFSEFVNSVESILTREHGAWAARRS
jgi:hypothetical protein